MNKAQDNWNMSQTRPGIVLLVTLALLVVLATLGYTLSSRVAAQRHRNQYIIDYSRARYGCDSAVKYALATLEELDAQLVDRPNEPDFSDLFALDEIGYQDLLAQWGMGSQLAGLGRENNLEGIGESNDVNDISRQKSRKASLSDPNSSVVIRGPYGPPWPLVTEPVEFEIGPTKVRIEIEDENAKYPLCWALLDDEALKREAEVGLETFCELMRLNAAQIDSLKEQLKQIGEIRPFVTDFKPITKAVNAPTPAPTGAKSGTTKTPPPPVQRKVIPVAEQVLGQTIHFAKLFHSSLIDTEALAAPTIISENRKESALKYMGLWGSQEVNINTAPRHVLEAAFIFGGNEVKIAEEIILHRREKTFTSVGDLKSALPRYSDSIGKCEKYITATSKLFTIRITAVSGAAKASSVIAMTKEGNQVKKIAVITG